MAEPRIVIIGSGGVASHLALALDRKAHVVQVCSRNLDHARHLAEKLRNCEAIDSLSEIVTDADFYLIAVTDDAITDVAAALPQVSGIVAHTSGSITMEALDAPGRRIGVFYPLQTFSQDVEVDVSAVPFFIEASDSETLAKLSNLALTIGASATQADSQMRARLHLAAVFACNFPNYLWSVAERLLAPDHLTLDIFQPLLQATLDKALTIGAKEAQTGPARRGDEKVCNRQYETLPYDLRSIYRLLSESINPDLRFKH